MGAACYDQYVKCKKFGASGVLKGIETNAMIGVSIDITGLNTLVSRWCTTTHTFFTAWREFTPTLEDVMMFTGFPLFGQNNLCDILLTDSEQEDYEYMSERISSNSKS